MNKDEYYMEEALKEANLALKENEVPVGAVLVLDDRIIAKSHNTREKDGLITSHAEINVINKSAKILHNYRLENATLYVTLEPCFMCSGAIYESRIKRVVFGAKDTKNGALGGKGDLFILPQLNHYTLITSMVKEKECLELLHKFFNEKR